MSVPGAQRVTMRHAGELTINKRVLSCRFAGSGKQTSRGLQFAGQRRAHIVNDVHLVVGGGGSGCRRGRGAFRGGGRRGGRRKAAATAAGAAGALWPHTRRIWCLPCQLTHCKAFTNTHGWSVTIVSNTEGPSSQWLANPRKPTLNCCLHTLYHTEQRLCMSTTEAASVRAPSRTPR